MTVQQQAQTANSTKQRAFDLQKIGSYIDGWGDLVEDMGGKEEEVRQEILKQLQERNMPEVGLEIMQGHVGLGRERRSFIVATIDPAVSVLISVRKYGKDLYVGWRSSIAYKVELRTTEMGCHYRRGIRFVHWWNPPIKFCLGFFRYFLFIDRLDRQYAGHPHCRSNPFGLGREIS